MRLFIGLIAISAIAAIAVSAAAAAASALLPPFNILDVEPNPCDTIRNGQFVCKDCQTLAFCVQKETGWETITMGTCSGSLFCDESTRGCSYQSECPLSIQTSKFQCQQPGDFPDPYNCQKYHTCNNRNEDQTTTCPSGTAYSPATGTCSLSDNNDICYSSQYQCPELGYMSAWPLNGNIYYICLSNRASNGTFIRYPALYRCPAGLIFRRDRCISSTNSSISTPTTTVITIPTVPVTSTCTTSNGLMVNANDCYSYFQCVQGQLVARRCPQGTYFESRTASCRFGTC